MSQVFENKSKKVMLEITSILTDTTSYVPSLSYIVNKWNWPDARPVSIWIAVVFVGSILLHLLIYNSYQEFLKYLTFPSINQLLT